MYAVFECLAIAIKEKGLRGLSELVPGAPYIVDVANHAYQLLRERQCAAAISEEIAQMGAATFEEAKKAAEQISRQVMVESSVEDRLTLEMYLTELPGAVRQAQAPAVNAAEDFAKLLPTRVPQFGFGPLEGGVPTVSILAKAIPAEPETWQVPLRGTWSARPMQRTEGRWIPTDVRLPGEVIAKPGEVYRLTISPDSTDVELAKLRALSGLPGLEAIDLSGCVYITDSGLMHLAYLRGLKAVALADTRVTDTGVTLLLTRFPDLEEVSLIGVANVTEAVVPHLARMRKLKHLALPPRADTIDIRTDFAKRRPACQVV